MVTGGLLVVTGGLRHWPPQCLVPGVLHPFLMGNKAGFGVNVLKLVLQSCELQLRIKVALIRDNFSWTLQLLTSFVTVGLISLQFSHLDLEGDPATTCLC